MPLLSGTPTLETSTHHLPYPHPLSACAAGQSPRGADRGGTALERQLFSLASRSCGRARPGVDLAQQRWAVFACCLVVLTQQRLGGCSGGSWRYRSGSWRHFGGSCRVDPAVGVTACSVAPSCWCSGCCGLPGLRPGSSARQDGARCGDPLLAWCCRSGRLLARQG